MLHSFDMLETMIVSFGNKATQKIWQRQLVRRLTPEFQSLVYIKFMFWEGNAYEVELVDYH